MCKVPDEDRDAKEISSLSIIHFIKLLEAVGVSLYYLI
jgi:hypothetical protein